MRLNHFLNHRIVCLLKHAARLITIMVSGLSMCFSQCPNVDAGQDFIICDTNQIIQLQGGIQGIYTKFFWTPSKNLSDPNDLNPIVTTKIPGKYTFKLIAEGATKNLIINGDFENGNSGFSTQYTLWGPPGQMPPGNYNVDINPAPYYAPEWSACTDHTSGGGNMFFANGANSCGKDFWCQTVSVSPNTNYSFQAFFTTMYPDNPPLIRISFNGTVMQNFQISSTTCDWLPCAFIWNSGGASSLTICMQDLLCNGQWGNDLAVDDISLIGPCTDEDEVNVIIVDLVAKIDILKKPKCSTDQFEITGQGSSVGPNFRYEWYTDDGELLTINGLKATAKGAGVYTLKVIYTDGNLSCEEEAYITVNVSDLEATLKVEGIANCKLDTILLKAIITNQNGNYSYQWTPANKILRGQNDSVAYVTDAGTYKLVIVDLDSDCKVQIQDVVISDTVKPNLKISADTLITCIKNEVSLFGSPFDTSKYLYEWLLPDSSKIKNIDSIFSKSGGVFLLKVIDKINNCYTDKIWSVKIDTLKPNIDLGPDQKIDCINTEIDIFPTGNNLNANINYYWTLPSGSLPIDSSLKNQKESKGGLAFLRLVNTINGCEDSDTMIIEDVRKIPFVDAGNGGTLNCKIIDFSLDGSNSKIDSTKYFWSTPTGNIASGSNTVNPIINAPGWYYFYVEDTSNHCNNVDSVFIDQNITTPNAILGPDFIFSCKDSIKTIDGSSSSIGANIIYQWSSINGNIKSGNGTNKIEVTSSGTFQLIVQDTLNGCNDTAFININPDLDKPVVSIKALDSFTCKPNVIVLSATYTSTQGAVDLQWTSGSGGFFQSDTTGQVQVLISKPGIYFLTVTDLANGCITTAQIVPVTDTVKPYFDLGPPSINWNCASKQIKLEANVSGNRNSYVYSWDYLGKIIGHDKEILIDSPGIYGLFVKDTLNDCFSIDLIQFAPDLEKPLIVIESPDTLNCLNKIIIINAQGSSPGNRWDLSWTTTNGNIIGNTNLNSIILDKPGWYTLFTLDTVNKCSSIDSVLVIEDKQLPIIDAGSPAELTCQIFDLILTGNIGNSTNRILNWKTNQGNILSQSDSLQIKIDKPGWYFLEVTNTSNGCVGIDSVLVTKRNDLVVDAGGSTELTCRLQEVTLSGSLQNSAGNEQIIWTTNQGQFIGNTNTTQVKADSPGWYYFVVTNNITGCNGIDSVLITENTNVPVSLNLNIDQPKCPGDFWQTEITNISGGEKPIQIYLDNQLITGLNMQGNSAGNYIIKVVDKNGCEFSTNFNIISAQGVTVQLIPLVKLSAGQDYNLIPVYSIPDDSIATVQWSPADFLSCTDCPYPIIKRIDKDIEYTVTYTNHNGCSATARIRIEISKSGIWVPNSFSPNGDNINDWFFPVAVEDSYNIIRFMSIYDRWGEQVFLKENFQANTPQEGWNGLFKNEKLNPGVFVYLIEVEWKNGERQILKGDLTLIR